MNIFEKTLTLLNKDYWQMSDNELCKLAIRYKLKGIRHKLFRKEELGDFEGLADDPEFIKEISLIREEIIEQLIHRDKFATSFLAIFISVLALIISTIALIKP